MELAKLICAGPASGKRWQQPFVIAEVGVNHEGSMETARRLIAEAKEGGADAVKFQTYKAHTLASRHSPSYWDTSKEQTRSQFELFQKHDRFWKTEFEALKTECDRQQIEFLSTPFDLASASFLNDLMGVFKISSSDITNHPFIQAICQYGKPVLLSTGASNRSEIAEALEWIQPFGLPVSLMHCVLNYPTRDEDANLGMIPDLQRHFPDQLIGYSDHTLPQSMDNLLVATLLGADVLEKHFTHDKTLPGNDHYHAMDRTDLRRFRERMASVLQLIGDGRKRALRSEEPARRNARRSLVAAREISVGTTLTSADVTWKRPAHGISPKHLEELLGRTAVVRVAEDELLQWHMFQSADQAADQGAAGGGAT